MKINAITLLAALVAVAIAFAGCRGNDVDKEELKQLKPDDVVQRVFSGIRTGEVASLPDYFDAQMDRDILKEQLEEMAASREIQSVRMGKPDTRKGVATVQYSYVFQEKKTAEDGRLELGQKMRELGTSVLIKDDEGIWKIRLLDAELADRDDEKWIVTNLDSKLDKLAEAKLFKDCVLAVEITKLAEQMYAANNNGDFTSSKDLLTNFITDYDPNACAFLKIDGIGVNKQGEKDYRITAETRNMPLCTIWATKEKTYPKQWDKKCLGQKNPLGK